MVQILHNITQYCVFVNRPNYTIVAPIIWL